MNPGLIELFAIIGGDETALLHSENSHAHYAAMDSGGQGELFGEADKNERQYYCFYEEDAAIVAALHSASPIVSALSPQARRLFKISRNAFDDITHAWMSELPIAAAIVRFGRKILAVAADSGNRQQAAEIAATDRSDPDVRTVHAAAFKSLREFDRLRGLLRFCPDEDGTYIACCEPDHFVLPALGPHFRERFGETPWTIVDNKRRICLHCELGQPPRLYAIGEGPVFSDKLPEPSAEAQSRGSHPDGEWGNLWRHYHKIINNESRNNPNLQRQFMPIRYWKYLNELKE